MTAWGGFASLKSMGGGGVVENSKLMGTKRKFHRLWRGFVAKFEVFIGVCNFLALAYWKYMNQLSKNFFS